MGSSWSFFDSSWGLLGGSWKGLGSSSGALGDALAMETLYFRQMKVSPRWEHDFQNLYYQGTGSETMRERLLARKRLEVIESMRA